MSDFEFPSAFNTPPTTLNRYAVGPISGGRAVKSIGDAQCGYADLTDPLDAQLLVGITVAAAADASLVSIQTNSELVEPSWDWSPGSPLFVGFDGQITATPPELSDGASWQRQVATAVSATRIWLVGRPPIFLA